MKAIKLAFCFCGNLLLQLLFSTATFAAEPVFSVTAVFELCNE